MRAVLLHNPNAGDGDTAADDLLAALAEGGVSASYCSAKSGEFPDALQARTDLVVIAGGDGTVVKAISHLRDRAVPLAILPLGSANNIAGSLGIEGAPTDLARAGWQQTASCRLDIGTAVLAEATAAITDQGVQGAERSRRARELLQ